MNTKADWNKTCVHTLTDWLCRSCLIYRIEQLESSLAASEAKRINEYANAARLVEWINDKNRKPAITAFTDGPERQVARAIEANSDTEVSLSKPKVTSGDESNTGEPGQPIFKSHAGDPNDDPVPQAEKGMNDFIRDMEDWNC